MLSSNSLNKQLIQSANSQVWIDKQSSTKVQFAYSPENPFVSGVTELKFNVEDSKRGTQLTDVFAKVTIIGVLPEKLPLKSYSIRSPNGNFSLDTNFLLREHTKFLSK